jgi:two-component system, LuxR family, sensor kinase FixL
MPVEDLRVTGYVRSNDARQRERDWSASESRYAFLFQNMQEGLAYCRMSYRDATACDYRYLEVNPAFERILGMRAAAGRLMSEVSVTSPHDWVSLATLEHVVHTGVPVRWEHERAGANKWFALAAYRPAPDEFIIVVDDISARKQAGMELRKLSLAVAQSPVSIVVTDLNGCIEYINPAFTLASGYSAAEAVGQNPRLLKSELTPAETYAELWATLAAGKTWRGEFVNRRKDGSTYVEAATISPLRQADGLVTHYVGVKEDVTDLKNAMGELRASEARLRLAKSIAGLGIVDWDIANDWIDWDERTREILGVDALEPISPAALLERVWAEDRAAMDLAIERALDPRGSGEFGAECRLIMPADGSVSHVVVSGRVFFEDARAVRLIATIKDVSLQKRQEIELRERRRDMELLAGQQVAAQTAAAIAHEMNQPLVSVSAYSEAALRMLKGGTKNPDRLVYAIEGAMTQAQRAGRTLHELLALLHKGDSAAEPLELDQVVREALAVAVESGYDGVRLVIGIEPDLPPVLANRLQVQKVLVNLICNSVEAMRDAAVAAPAITIKVRTMAGRGMAQVTLQDNGPGLDPEAGRRVFEPFYTTKPTGTGLGLTISRTLVEGLGGQMWADLQSESGAVFHLTLPFAK